MLIIALLVLVYLRWTTFRGIAAALSMMISTHVWIVPILLVAAGYAKVTSFWMLVFACALHFVAVFIVLIPAGIIGLPLGFLVSAVRRVVRPQGWTMCQLRFVGGVQTTLVMAPLEYLALYGISKLLGGFQLTPFPFETCAILALFGLLERIGAAMQGLFPDRPYAFTPAEVWNLPDPDRQPVESPARAFST